MKRICEQCGAELLDGAKYCTNCGKEYKEEKMCPNCNAPIKDGAKFCTRCGYNLEKSVKGKRNIGKWIRVLLFVLGVFLLPSIVIPIGVIWGVVALLKKKGIWEKMNKGVKIGGMIVLILLFGIIVVGSDGSSDGSSDGGSHSNKKVIKCESAPYEAAYNYDYEETVRKVNEILTEYYEKEVDIEKDFQNEVEEQSNWRTYTYVDVELGIGVELSFAEEGKLTGFVIKTTEAQEISEAIENYKSPWEEDRSKPSSAQILFCMMVNEMTDDKLEIEEIKDVMQSEYKGKYWDRNNNLYKIGINTEEGVIAYLVVAELVDEN